MMPLFRLARIAVEIARFGAALVASYLPWSRTQPSQQLCASLTRLGTTFIKFGQALSLRQDLLPREYIKGLQSLQDHVAPFSAQAAMREIERAFGRPLEELFADINRKPLAAASIAQVHTAHLLDGQEVIVKIRRPHIDRQIERDMRALSWLARVAASQSRRLRHYEPARIIDEIWSNLSKETDFRREARNIQRFSLAFADWPTIHIPAVAGDLASETVIVQQRSAGRRIDDPALAAEGPRLAQNFVDAYLHQIFVLGVFHGDPHPGNLFITAEGRICFHDFGLVGFLDRATRRKLAYV